MWIKVSPLLSWNYAFLLARQGTARHLRLVLFFSVRHEDEDDWELGFRGFLVCLLWLNSVAIDERSRKIRSTIKVSETMIFLGSDGRFSSFSVRLLLSKIRWSSRMFACVLVRTKERRERNSTTSPWDKQKKTIFENDKKSQRERESVWELSMRRESGRKNSRILSGDRHQIYNRLFSFPFSLAHVQNNRLVPISVISFFPRYIYDRNNPNELRACATVIIKQSLT